jgi:hypothetical protein
MASGAGTGGRCTLNRGCYHGTQIGSCSYLRPGGFETFAVVCRYSVTIAFCLPQVTIMNLKKKRVDGLQNLSPGRALPNGQIWTDRRQGKKEVDVDMHASAPWH